MSGSNSVTTAIPSSQFGTAGFYAPSEQAILAGAQIDISNAFGGGINPSLTTPQGQIAQSETAIVGDCNNQFLALANGVDPAYATGRLQDAIGRIYFMERIAAASTVVDAACSGATGVVIPYGAVAQDSSGYTYTALSSGTISAAGTVVIPFANTVTGPIACATGALNTISQVVPQWDSITNAASGAPGLNVETQAAFELRRQSSVAANSVNTNQALQAAVAAVPGVLSCFVRDNPTSGTVSVNGVSINPYAMYISVSGGASTAVAQAILSKRPPGTPMMGSTSVTVSDPNPVYGSQAPSYSINYQQASNTGVNVAVSLANLPTVPSTALTSITMAVNAAFAGTDGGLPVSRIAATVFSSRFYAGIAALGTWAQIVDIFVGTGTPTSNTQTMTAAQVPTIGTITLTLV